MTNVIEQVYADREDGKRKPAALAREPAAGFPESQAIEVLVSGKTSAQKPERDDRAKHLRGMGRIFQRGSTWWVAYWHRGREHRESSHSLSEASARKLLKKRLGEIGRGRLVGPTEEKLTFETMAEDLLRDYSVNGKRSVRCVKLSVAHLRKFFGLERALDITTDRVRGYIAFRQEGKSKDGRALANASINRELSALKRMFSLAVKAGRISSSPHVPLLEEQNARQGFLDHAGFISLRENLPEHLKDPVTFLYLSGWRVSEMRALEWRDVDLTGKVVRLRPELSKNKDGRLLPLSGDLLEIFDRVRDARRLDCSFVFHIDGEQLGSFRKTWTRACKAAGVSGLLVHDLRRTAIRNMVRAGIHERVAMALSGHKTRAIFDRYNIVSEADLADATARLHAHLERQPKEASVTVLRSA